MLSIAFIFVSQKKPAFAGLKENETILIVVFVVGLVFVGFKPFGKRFIQGDNYPDDNAKRQDQDYEHRNQERESCQDMNSKRNHDEKKEKDRKKKQSNQANFCKSNDPMDRCILLLHNNLPMWSMLILRPIEIFHNVVVDQIQRPLKYSSYCLSPVEGCR